VKLRGETVERDLSTSLNATVSDISADGQNVVLWDGNNTFLRSTRGGDPILLARGRWVEAFHRMAKGSSCGRPVPTTR
jgi:hypothetical protein